MFEPEWGAIAFIAAVFVIAAVATFIESQCRAAKTLREMRDDFEAGR